MTDTNGTNMYMPVAPAGYGNGFGGDWGSWIILFLIFGMFGGGWGGNGMNNMYPWLNQSDQINSGFQNQLLANQLTGIQNAVTNGFATSEVAACNRAMADMERSFAEQTAITQGMTGLQGQLAQCCCDNRLATAQTQNVVQTEGAATRLAIQNQTQQILDKMCQQEIDALKTQNLALQNQLNIATFNASQVAQTAQILAGITPAARTTTTNAGA